MNFNIDKYQRKAEILTKSLPYLRDFNQKIIVIGYMCSDILSGEEEQELMRDITTLQSVGMKLVIVHDTRMGAGKFRENKRLAKLVELCGIKAIGICGVDEQTLHMTIDNGYIPVITPNDIDTEYVDLNPIDTAQQIASLLHAEKLVYLTRYQGIETGSDDEDNNHIYSMTVSELSSYIRDNTIDPRLQKMLENAVTAINNGVTRVHVIGAKLQHALLLELFSIRGVGTVFMSDERIKYSHELE